MDEFESVLKLRHLYKAAKKCGKGSMWKAGTAVYCMDALKNSYKVRRDMLNGIYKMQKYIDFEVTRPKPRKITATRIRDRHPQRSLCDNFLYPAVTRSFVYDNGACQKGKGVDFQLDRAVCALQRFYRHQRQEKALELGCRVEDVPPFEPQGWIYKGDVRKYFPSTLHTEVKKIVDRRVRDERIRAWLYCVIESFGEDWWQELAIQNGVDAQAAENFARKVTDARMEHAMLPIRPESTRQDIRCKCVRKIRMAVASLYVPPEGKRALYAVAMDAQAPVRGIALGSQISQILQLAQLDHIDHYMLEVVRPHTYQRYMDDDWALDKKREVVELAAAENARMLHELGLEVNPKSQVYPLSQGLVFLKWHLRLTPTGAVTVRAAPGVAKSEKRRLRRMVARAKEGKATVQSIRDHYMGWRAHMERGDTDDLLEKMDKYLERLIKEIGGDDT